MRLGFALASSSILTTEGHDARQAKLSSGMRTSPVLGSRFSCTSRQCTGSSVAPTVTTSSATDALAFKSSRKEDSSLGIFLSPMRVRTLANGWNCADEQMNRINTRLISAHKSQAAMAHVIQFGGFAGVLFDL